MSDQRMVVVRTEEDVQKHLAQAWERLEEACEGEMPATLPELHGVDAKAFSMLVEGMVQLGEPVEPEMQELAGLKPVDQVIAP
ncbi:hypothetical protein OIU91_17095 [Streptomyces sp. NBC_01456]|uniref:hypothetical protein n=1 Tax=Streptomyces sp. NBC_01456 TaxID=2975868 RepID=UPI002E369062|nr:hypothetical protein [Streptomyces sp. NBC_01456]